MQATFTSNTAIQQVPSRKPATILMAAAKWLTERDGQYRQARKLRELTDVRLTDVGLSRDDANTAFFRGHANHTAGQKPIILGNAW